MLSGARRLLIVSAIALGVTIAGGGGTLAVGQAPDTGPEEELDHFKCYTTAKTAFKRRTVELKDQFGGAKTGVLLVHSLCNPVNKDGGKVRQRRVHLVCYRTRDAESDFKEQRVRVRNQFGEQVLSVLAPTSLCVPSLKRKGKLPPRPTPDPATLVDHFRCYNVKPVEVEKAVKLTDQFTTVGSRVKLLVRLCNPVSKNGEEVLHPKAHLVCYSITDAQRFAAVNVRVRNQFGLLGLRALKPQTLCLPSFKERLG